MRIFQKSFVYYHMLLTPSCPLLFYMLVDTHVCTHLQLYISSSPMMLDPNSNAVYTLYREIIQKALYMYNT